MEQFRAFLEVLKKYHFWVLCGLILLLSFVSWFLATGDEAKRFVDRKGKIDGKLRLVKDIAGNAEHPSANYIGEIRKIESGTLTSQVANASGRLYNEQRMNNPLPRLFPDDKDQAGFEAAIEKIWQPMEEIEKLPPGLLDEFYRSRYRNHIEEHFPKLLELIERRTVVGDEPAVDRSGRGGGGIELRGGNAGALAKSTSGIVDWVDADQKKKAFLDRFSGATPSTLDIMMAQEDLWVYETLLKVIRYTNNVGPDRTQFPKPANDKGAHVSSKDLMDWLEKNYKKPKDHKWARIKRILAMDIGKDAVQSWHSSENALFNAPSEGGGNPADNSRRAPPPMPPTSRGAATSAGNAGVSPLADRYVDDNGKPLSDPTQQPYGEFRMVPIDLQVVIEQKEIPRLLAECANSAMRIDVRRVRILVETPPPVDFGGSAGGDRSTGGGMGQMSPPPQQRFGPIGRHDVTGGDGGSGKNGFVYNEESADPVNQPVPVEVQGIIYIYNPPKVQSPSETTGDSGGRAPPAPPSGGTPADAVPGPGQPAPATPAAKPDPVRGPAPAGPAAAGVPSNPPTIPPTHGGHP